MPQAMGNARVLLPYRHPTKLKPYEDALRAGGIEPVPAFAGDAASLDGAAGLLLMGGTDVNPERYGEPRRPETDEPDDQRDEFELRLIHEALERDLPILAICRGLQILNVYHGGTLVQHLSPTEPHDPDNEDKSAAVHEIDIEPDSHLARIAQTDRWPVNSRHHQAAQKIGHGLKVTARASQDRTVEALEQPEKRFVLAVQWHPEDQVRAHREQLKLFRAFAAAIT
jgi:putative glutamine amidotransferase